MAEMKTVDIHEGASLHAFIDPNFKTMRISVNMLLPISRETAATYGMLPSLVSKVSKKYPDYTSMGQHLAQLYGAYVDCNVSKLGEFQVLTVAVGGLANQYAFGGENIEDELTQLVLSVLFDPLRDEDGLFGRDSFQREKRQILEIFDAEYNDKITYARRRAIEIMYDGAAEGIGRYGAKEDVEKLGREQVSAAWNEIIKNARYEIFILGNCSPDIEKLTSAFENFGRLYSRDLPSGDVPKVKREVEKMELAQSKLVMTYRALMDPCEEYIYRLMSAVLGGTPSSKLFTNVREKMSLCYYCSASFNTANAAMMIESGVETQNVEKAQQAILDQLEQMTAGNISDDEIMYAKLAICNAYRAVTDSLHGIEGWYLQKSLSNELHSPVQAIEKIQSVTKDEIIRAANRLRPDTVYVLQGAEGDM